MSQWRIRGYVQDSDEEDDLDLDDAYTPNPPEAISTAVGDTGALTAPQSNRVQAKDNAVAIPLGSQDELALDSSQNRVPYRTSSQLDVTRPSSSSTVRPNEVSPQSARRAQDDFPNANSESLASLVDIRNAGHPSSEIPIASSENALSKKFLATQLFSDERLTSTPAPDAQGRSPRPVTPTLQDGLDELQQNWPVVQNGGISVASSPLSDARSDIERPDYLTSSPPPGWRRELLQERTHAGVEGGSRHFAHVGIPPQRESELDRAAFDDLPDAEKTRIRRALRKRNPIQLHPYLLEAEKYRQNLKARGMKPVNVGSEQQRHHEKHHGRDRSHEQTQDLDSQDRDFVVDQSSSVRHSSPVDLPSSPPGADHSTSVPLLPDHDTDVGNTNVDVDDEDYEFPDLGALLRRNNDGGVQQGLKRRKIQHTFSKKGSLHRTSSLPQSPFVNELDRGQQAREVLEIPPSPPASETPPVQDQQIRKAARFPLLRRLSPIQIPQPPTPSMSSTRKPAQTRLVDSDSDDELPISTARQRGSRRATSLTVLSSSESSSESEHNEDNVLRQAKKRIKGVLPASWLRLDQQAQANRRPITDPLRHQRRTSEASTRLGTVESSVASRRASPELLTEQEGHLGPSLIDDDSGWDGDANSSEVPQLRRNLYLELGFADSFENPVSFEVPEHDWVDPMLPSGSRQSTNRKPARKRQLKLTDTIPSSTKRPRLDSFDRPTRSRTGHGISKPKSKPNERKRSRRQPRSRPPNLSILDAPVLNNPEPMQVPQFLRLAARQVRRQPNKGRHSPTNKHIRLQTEADTEEANSALREWCAGRVRPSTRYDRDIPGTRPPLSDRVANQQGNLHQQQLPEPEKIQEDDKHEARSTEPKQHAAQSGKRQPRMRQVKLNPIAISRDSSPTLSSTKRQPKSNISIAHRPSTQRMKPKQPEYRAAQLERPENDYDSHHRAAAFRKKLSQLDRMYARANQLQFRNAWAGQRQNPRLAKFLEDDDEVAPLPAPQSEPDDIVSSVETEPPLHPAKPKRRLKAKVQRVDVETREYRQPSDPLPPVQEDISPPPVQVSNIETPRLEGLGPFGTRYPTDFDVSPLWSGTFFHETTMIGSGEFQQALNVDRRDLDAPGGLSTFSHNGTMFRWGAWTEEVASDIASLLSSTASRLEQAQSAPQSESWEDGVSTIMVDYLCLLRNLIRYFSTHLHFLDPVDRRSYVVRIQGLLDSASGNILADLVNLSDNSFQGNNTEKMKIRLSITLLLLVHQVTQVASHPQVDNTIKQSTELLFTSLVKPVLQLVLRKGMGELRGYIDENRRHTAREQGIREEKLAIEGLVMVYHMLDAHQSPQWSFWALVKEEWTPSVSKLCQVWSFERLWFDIFALLPYLEIDANGLIRTGHRFQTVQGDWSIVAPLLNRLFILYPETSQKSESSINVYVRSCLARCYNLIHSWGWKKCDALLTTVFDFFSRRGFTHLQNEESRVSPRFLENLNQHPNLDIQPDDRAFHVFLKTLASGFRGLRSNCTERQIQNIAWRLVPNHRRTYHKEEDLRQEDLDGLRNQHDLLCTLYWASPLGFRPRLTSLRNLVDQTRSHREVCRLSVRAWSNLARFQISTDEGLDALDPFADWFKEIVSQNLTQHKLARSEAENQYEAARFLGDENISAEHLQLTIKNNQAQILATLGDAVYGMKAAIEAAHDAESATSVLQKSAITDIFRLFDAKNSQASKLIAEVLEVFQTYLRLVLNKRPQEESQQTSEDSQDYGGGFSLEDIEQEALDNATVTGSAVDFVHDAVWQLVSSCFGAEIPPDDALLTTVVETWTMIAHHLVQKGQSGWSSFLDSYHANSWRQLRNTEQTRKYSALFMSAVLNQDRSSYDDQKDDMFWSWLVSLVERESMLKFQHRLTTSLMNRDPNHPLLRNLPFLKESRSGRVDIKLSEFRQRRLGLISSVLANIRDDYEAAMQAGRRDLPGLRREYGGLLKHFMEAMKKNYLELGQNSHVKSAYVEFVQSVVEFLQQHTHDICPVDQFFTDSSAFPLPATDPTYVVGRLKSYVPKLSEQRTLKQLVSFLQNVSERAAVDNEQAYLASQLRTATTGKFERGDVSKPTLRQVLLGAIFPAYIESIFKTTAGWILAKPLLQASRPILEELNYQRCQYSITDPDSVAIVETILSTMLDALYSATELLITHSGLLEQPHILHTLSLLTAAATATVLPASHLYRRAGRAAAAVQRIDAFKAFSLFAASTLLGTSNGAFSPYPPADPDPLSADQLPWLGDVRQLCARDLAQALEGGSWGKQDEQYFLTRKSGRRAIATAVGSLEEEKRGVIRAIEEFHAVLGVALWRGEEDLAEKKRRGKERSWPRKGGELCVV